MAETEIKMDDDGYTYEDTWGDNLGVSLGDGIVLIGSLSDGDFIWVKMDREAVEHLRDALTDWLEG